MDSENSTTGLSKFCEFEATSRPAVGPEQF